MAHEQHCKQMEERFVHVCQEYQKLEMQAREMQAKTNDAKTKIDLEAHLRREVETRASNLQNQVSILSTQLQVLQSAAKEHSSMDANLEARHRQEIEEATRDLKNKLAERAKRLAEVEEKLIRVERERNQMQASQVGVGAAYSGAAYNSAGSVHGGSQQGGGDYMKDVMGGQEASAPPKSGSATAQFTPSSSFRSTSSKPASAALKGLSDLLASTGT